jgi:hypothetical protein
VEASRVVERMGRRCERARHLAAPLLATWLLLGPPIRDVTPVPDAPLAEWKRYGVFPTEGECRGGLELMRRMTGTEKYGWERTYWDELARCVAADDDE